MAGVAQSQINQNSIWKRQCIWGTVQRWDWVERGDRRIACAVKTHVGFMEKFKEKGSRNGGLQNEGEEQLPDMIARIWGRSQTDPPGFFQDKNIPYTFAESNNVIEQCCNTEDLELKMSYFITLQWQRVALQGVTKPTRHWVLRRCTFSLHLASPGENWVPDRPWCSRWWACVWVLMSVTLLVLLLKWGLPILAAIHMPQRSGGGPRWRRLTPWHPEHVWGRRYCR